MGEHRLWAVLTCFSAFIASGHIPNLLLMEHTHIYWYLFMSMHPSPDLTVCEILALFSHTPIPTSCTYVLPLCRLVQILKIP